MIALPVATKAQVRAQARQLVRKHPRALAAVLAVNGLATACGLVAPWLLGDLVEAVALHGGDIERTVLLICVSIAAQAALSQYATYLSAQLGEDVLADLRERFVGNVLALPLSTVEAAGTGDLVTRSTRDIDALSGSVRSALPDAVVSLITIVFAFVALVIVSPLVAVPCLLAVPVLWVSARWYFSRSRAGYLRQNATYSDLTQGLTETVEGARTVEAFGLADQRMDQLRRDVERSYAAERYTLRLRTIYLPIADVSLVLPVAATLVIGGLFYIDGLVTLAAVTAAVLYVQLIIPPLDLMLARLEEIQIGGAALARLAGVQQGRQVETATPATVDPGDGTVEVSGVHFAYRPGRDVIRDVTLRVHSGERLAVVGASGAGKSTLGRLIAGIETPRTGSVTIGGVPLNELSPRQLRRLVALVTQEYHVFRGSLRDNLILARPEATDEELDRALAAVDATPWAEPLGLDGVLGAGGRPLTPAEAQQLSLARLLLVDPQVLVLDEATSMLDPRAARHIERSLGAVLRNRTVVMIAHRLLTTNDADRVAVMNDGQITECAPHDDLVRRGGGYAALWQSWHGRVTPN